MKKLLLVLSILGFCKAKNLANLDFIDLPCFMSAMSKDFYACSSGEILDSELKTIKKLANNISFLDNFNDEILAISIDDDGVKTLNFIKDNANKTLKISSDINKAFLSRDYIVLISLASEIRFIKKSDFSEFKKEHFSYASISASNINHHQNILALGFESGVVLLYDLNNFNYVKKELHKDNVYNVDYKVSGLISCSTDRKAILSDKNLNEIKSYEAKNLVYNCALSDDGVVAFSCDDENNICINNEVYNTQNLYINSIDFKGSRLRVNAYDDKVFYKDFK